MRGFENHQRAAGLPAVIAAAPPRGEYVLVIDALPAGGDVDAGAADEPAQIDPVTLRWLLELGAHMPASRAASIASKVSGLPRALLYGALGRRDPQD